MPLLAGLHEAFAAAGRDIEHQPGIDWLSTFCSELALRLPLSLILAFTVFALIGAAGAFLSRLDGASVSAQAARHDSDLKEIIPVVPNPPRSPSCKSKRHLSGIPPGEPLTGRPDRVRESELAWLEYLLVALSGPTR
jgi:hypothetical protein